MSTSRSKSCNGIKPRGEFRFKRSQRHNEIRNSWKDSTTRRRRKRERAASDTCSSEHIETPRHDEDYLAPNVAFRESLFDALADEAGAAFWQGVYGQPIHNYSNTFTNSESGQIEVMDDEQYANFVRRKMWEKSREGIEAARQDRDRRRTGRRQKEHDEDQAGSSFETLHAHAHAREYEVFNLEIDESICRANARKEHRYWRKRWQDYLGGWDSLERICRTRKESTVESDGQISLLDQIPWPTGSGSWHELCLQDIKGFFENVAAHNNTDGDVARSEYTMIKMERVRWHPDKMQQRYGGIDLEQDVIEHITAVFQILDDLRREKSKGRA